MAEEVNRAWKDQYMLRFPEGMRDEIKASADINGRSMNAEIIQRLKQSYSHREDDRLKLDLPTEIRNALMIDAYARGKSEDERAGEILAGAFDPEDDYTVLLDRLQDEVSKTMYLEEQVDQLKQQLERDFVLYYNKASQLGQFVRQIKERVELLPADLAKTAQQLEALADTELALLQQRYEDGKFWVARRDIEIENTKDLMSGGEGG